MKKGFTLIELIGIIVLLGVITTVVYPMVTKTIKKSREKAYSETVQRIEQAAKMYGVAHDDILPEVGENQSTTVTLQSLIREGYLTKTDNGKIYNPIDDSEMTGCVFITYNDTYSQYVYSYQESCE